MRPPLRTATPFILALALAVLTGCTSDPPPACPVGAPMLTAELYFGRTQHGGEPISATDWQDFLAREVTPRFPDGLTVIEASGQWRSRTSGTINHEPSTILLIVTEPTKIAVANLDAIRDAYRTRFAQESVGLVITSSCGSF